MWQEVRMHGRLWGLGLSSCEDAGRAGAGRPGSSVPCRVRGAPQCPWHTLLFKEGSYYSWSCNLLSAGRFSTRRPRAARGPCLPPLSQHRSPSPAPAQEAHIWGNFKISHGWHSFLEGPSACFVTYSEIPTSQSPGATTVTS